LIPLAFQILSEHALPVTAQLCDPVPKRYELEPDLHRLLAELVIPATKK
jgi:hypothetical protein